MAATAADQSTDPDVRVWVRGRAAIALGYEGASLGVADVLADQALALSDRPSLGLLNAVYGKAHAAALRGDHATARALDARGRRIFDTAGSYEQTSDYAVPWWRLNVFRSLLLARLGDERAATEAQDQALAELPAEPAPLRHPPGAPPGPHARPLRRQGRRHRPRHHRNERPPPEEHSLTLRMLLAEIQA